MRKTFKQAKTEERKSLSLKKQEKNKRVNREYERMIKEYRNSA